MPVVVVHQGPTLTQQSYEEAVRNLTGKARLESPADRPVPGLLVHLAGHSGSGFRVVDVWESQEAARRFGDFLMPVLHEPGVEDPPEMYPAHTFVAA